MSTYTAKPETIKCNWYCVDASDQIIGRLATGIAHRLRGKHKAEFTPHVDTGDYIIVTNVDKIRISGRKDENKIYYRHTGYPGGIKSETFEDRLSSHPQRALESAVKGMLPKGPLGRQMIKKLKIYSGGEHPHHAQQPQTLVIGEK